MPEIYFFTAEAVFGDRVQIHSSLCYARSPADARRLARDAIEHEMPGANTYNVKGAVAWLD